LDHDVLEDAVEVLGEPLGEVRSGPRTPAHGEALMLRRSVLHDHVPTTPGGVRAVAPIRLQPAGRRVGSEAVRHPVNWRAEMETMLRGVLCSRFDTPVGEVWVVHDGAEPLAIRSAGSEAEVEEWCLSTLGVVPEPADLPAALRRRLEDAAAGSGDWRPRLEGLGDFQRRG